MSRLERLLTIHRLLSDGRHLDCRALCTLCEVRERAIYLDIAYLRTRLGAPIVYRAGAYRYSRPFTLDEAARLIIWPR